MWLSFRNYDFWLRYNGFDGYKNVLISYGLGSIDFAIDFELTVDFDYREKYWVILRKNSLSTNLKYNKQF